MTLIERLPHIHQWFSTGEMKPGQIRCFSCGKWGETYDAEKTEIERLTAERDLLKEQMTADRKQYLDMRDERNALKADAERYRWLLAQDQPVWRTLEYETSDWINAAIDSAIQGAKT